LRLASHGGLLKWEFTRRRKTINAHVSGRLVFSSSELIVAAALSGHGLAWVPSDTVEEHIARGRLESVLDDWAATFEGYHLYYATRRASPALMFVVEALRQPESR
jgi:DNA-binding transcriptional LysR family regulator